MHQRVDQETPDSLALPRTPAQLGMQAQAVAAAKLQARALAAPGVLALPRAPAPPAEQVKQQLQQAAVAAPEAAHATMVVEQVPAAQAAARPEAGAAAPPP